MTLRIPKKYHPKNAQEQKNDKIISYSTQQFALKNIIK
jgi:hypothetical protein